MYLFFLIVVFSGDPTLVNYITDFWIPTILIMNAIIVTPIVAYRKLDLMTRQKFIKFLTKLSWCLFLISMIFIHIPSFLNFVHSDFGWTILAVYLFSIPFLFILGFRFVTRKQRLNSSVSNMSNIMSIIFDTSLIIWSTFIIFAALQAIMR